MAGEGVHSPGGVNVPITGNAMPAPELSGGGPGRGVKGGVPYGEQLATERRELERDWKFRPAALARLRAKTRQALGR